MPQTKVLIINNDEAAARYLKEGLAGNGGYSVFCAMNARIGLETFRENSFDVTIVKIDMPDSDAATLVKGLKKIDPHCIIIAFAEENDPSLIKEISRLGVYDFINKPINLEKLTFLIKKGVELRLLTVTHHKLASGLQEQNISLQKQNALLVKRIEESTKNLTRLYEDLRSTYMRTIKALAQTIDAKDHYTHSHSQNVARYAVVIARQMHLSDQEINLIRDACELHDLGKIGVEDSILGKPSELTDEERELIKKHPQTAAKILEPLTFLSDVLILIRQHHENYDGSGYPDGLRDDEILLGARIIHLADAYDAMRSPRSYRKIPLSQEETIYEIKKNSGTQFDPKVVDAFLKAADKL